jgi:uncharacterized protein YdeI (YjbR/CyaY-like superfamily)
MFLTQQKTIIKMINKNEFYAKSNEEWFEWLNLNHNVENEIWLLMFKERSKNPTLSYEESINTALCFGWVEVIVKRKDDFSYYRVFKKRNKKSSWSEKNKIRAEILIKNGLMQEAGFQSINDAKENGEWYKKKIQFIDEKSELMFFNILKEYQDLFHKYNSLSQSHKNQYLNWISSAKKDDTKINRINKAIEILKSNKKFSG